MMDSRWETAGKEEAAEKEHEEGREQEEAGIKEVQMGGVRNF